jgi:hypothetical protein
MTQANTLMAGAAAIALAQCHRPRDDTEATASSLRQQRYRHCQRRSSAVGRADDTVKQSAYMGKADGVRGGEHQGEESKSQRVNLKG